ncbi:serine hydrolase [Brachybacterium vulturis]|uniref:Serine hydrolase n=1 Tax=Brachybacterium vulturis TaxID=2017484 RepID=A0A291GKX1_9MICO|nr:serine hydrolase [Brachybacterium vulturis]ATG50702.1 serine hydrolase [Brachybacterium vulturis]
MDPRMSPRRGPTAGGPAAADVAGLPAATGDPGGHEDRPAPGRRRGGPHRHPWAGRSSGRTLREARPDAVGLDAEVLAQLPGIIRAGLENSPPRFAGASLLVASRAGIAYEHADGQALRWQDASTELPRDQWIPARTDTLFDLASISKIVTATAVMQHIEQGLLRLEDRVADQLPRFAEHGKGEVTVQQLLTHVSGLPAWIDLCTAHPDVPSRIDAVLTAPLQTSPGSTYTYSDLGLITLGLIVEKLSGTGLDEYVREHITAPLGMTETMYNPPAQLRDRIAATEYVDADGRLVHGHVHDENAWSLGGVAGHAGVFSTARDLAVFAQMFLDGGRCGGARILEASTVQDMFTDRIAEVTGAGGARRGLGPELAAWTYHAGLTSPYSGVHTGFTGTSLVIDPLTDTIVILLTNSVHPTREWSSTSVTRREVSTCVAHALGVVPQQIRGGWQAGDADASTATLSFAAELRADLQAGLPATAAELHLDLFAHLETDHDILTVEASADQGETWLPLPGRLEAPDEDPVEVPDGRITGWGRRVVWDGTFALADGGAPLVGEVQIRLRLTTGGPPRGLGARVGRLRVLDGGHELFDSHRPDDRREILADGWVLGG